MAAVVAAGKADMQKVAMPVMPATVVTAVMMAMTVAAAAAAAAAVTDLAGKRSSQ